MPRYTHVRTLDNGNDTCIYEKPKNAIKPLPLPQKVGEGGAKHFPESMPTSIGAYPRFWPRHAPDFRKLKSSSQLVVDIRWNVWSYEETFKGTVRSVTIISCWRFVFISVGSGITVCGIGKVT